MKYLFCGLGSIGERHLSNLIATGETEIIAFRKNNLPLRTVNKKIRTFLNIDDVLKEKPDIAFITNPSQFHIPLAQILADNGCHLFIEKPLSSTLSGVKKLLVTSKKKKLIVKVGFMMRYHPAIKQIKKWLDENTIGIPLFAKVTWGEYLPAWHPWEDYSKGYTANKAMGGGPINSLCHDIDLLSWFFGQPSSVFAAIGRNSSLKISTEHSAELLLQYKNRFLAEVHLDFLQLPPKRVWEIVGDKGKIEFDFYKNTLNLFLINKKKLNYKEIKKKYSGKFKRNDMFVEELKKFIVSIRNKTQPEITLQDGINNLKILIAAHKSISKKRIVELKEIML